ncbi:MAG: hypothetical protein WCI74_09865 [Actinomycetes bacterium]
MTAVSHPGVGRTPLAGRVGARLVRPSSRGATHGVATAGATAGAATAGSPASGIGALASSISTAPVRLVLSGARVRLGSRAFVLVVLGSLSLTLATLLFLNTSLAQDSFRLRDIRQNAKDLQLREQVLIGQLAAAESPVGLGKRAIELGMVAPNGPSQYLNLSTGDLIGPKNAGIAPPVPKVKTPKPAETPATTDAGATGSAPAGAATSAGDGVGGEVAVDPVTGLPITGVSGAANGVGGTGVGGSTTYPAPDLSNVPLAQAVLGGEQPLGLVSGGSR